MNLPIWKAYSGEDTNHWWVIHDENDNEIGSTDGGFEEHQARLMAAAPELLKTNKTLLALIDDLHIASSLLPEVQAEIKNAYTMVKTIEASIQAS